MTLPEESSLSDALSYADGWLAFRQALLRIPGIQAAVLVGHEIRLSTAHGLADVDGASALTPGHLFRIASHSKTFTATAVLRLVEAGRLRLDDRVGDLLPRLAGAAAADRTVRALLAHASGLTRDGADADHWQLWQPFPDADRLFALAADPQAPVFGPDEQFKYSNVAYSMLGAVVAAASGISYNAYVRTEIIDRLGLADTGPEFDPTRAGDYATGYSSFAYASRRVPIDHVDTGAMSAATGFYGTAADVVRYAAAHFTGDERLLTDASKRLMQHEQWKVGGEADHYGLGFSLEDIGDRHLVGHSGGFPGFMTKTVFDPVDGVAVSVFTNAIDGPAGELATGVVRLVNLAGRPRPSTVPAAPAGVDVHRFAGRFASLFGVTDVVVLGSRVYLIDPTAPDPGENPTELAVLDDTTLSVAQSSGYGLPGERLRFVFDDAGTSVRRVRGIQGWTGLPIEEFAAALEKRTRITRG
jgi:CubicO group peptidase (beta-lactamase class C family)